MKKQLLSATVALSLVLAGSTLSLGQPAYATASASTTLTGKITGNPYFHKTPVSGEATMGFVRKGSVVKVLDVSNKSWIKIEYNGKTGWVYAKYIEVAGTTSTGGTSTSPTAPATPAASTPSASAAPAKAAWEQSADKLISYAKSLIGKVQYGYAKRVTSDPNHLLLDCSSYTQYVYKQSLGVSMRWGANAQHDAFPHVAKANLRKGDLVFFSVGTPGKIGHVGIYIGNGQFIHNVNTTSDVTISTLSSGYWSRHYIDGARPLK